MKLNGLIYTFPSELKLLTCAFLISLSIGFFSGLSFVKETSSVSVKGIEENYLGNDEDEEASVMKFKKSPKEMLSIIHSHILSMSVIFLILGLFIAITDLSRSLKLFLMLEPFFSIVLTFGGIYFLWKEVVFMKYIVMFSGLLMTLTFSLAVSIISIQLLKTKK